MWLLYQLQRNTSAMPWRRITWLLHAETDEASEAACLCTWSTWRNEVFYRLSMLLYLCVSFMLPALWRRENQEKHGYSVCLPEIHSEKLEINVLYSVSVTISAMSEVIRELTWEGEAGEDEIYDCRLPSESYYWRASREKLEGFILSSWNISMKRNEEKMKCFYEMQKKWKACSETDWWLSPVPLAESYVSCHHWRSPVKAGPLKFFSSLQLYFLREREKKREEIISINAILWNEENVAAEEYESWREMTRLFYNLCNLS